MLFLIRIIISLGASFLLYSCNSFSLEKYCKEQFVNCNYDSCMVDFADLPFDWDTLYYYVEHNKFSDVESPLTYEKGFFFDKYVDNDISEKEDIPLLSSIIIFKLNGKTVFHESWYYYYYLYYKNPVFLKSNKQILIKDRNNASFILFDVSQTYILVDPEELSDRFRADIQGLRNSRGPLFSRITF